jgi:hypothetical protein
VWRRGSLLASLRPATEDEDMVLVVLTVVAGLLVGFLRGGRLRHLADAPLRAAWLAGLAALAQFLFALAPTATSGVVLTALSQAGLLAFLWRNRYLAGATLVALGSLLNSLVILSNGAMPVSREALLAVSRLPAEVGAGRHRLLESTDALPWLADVIALPLLRTVVSAGDVVLAAGIGLLVADLMRPRRQPEGSASAAQPVDGLDEPLA